jgi:hypothetical protein
MKIGSSETMADTIKDGREIVSLQVSFGRDRDYSPLLKATLRILAIRPFNGTSPAIRFAVFAAKLELRARPIIMSVAPGGGRGA